MNKINWLDHFVNLIVVILGITVAYTLNNVRETNKTKELQNTYIQSMIDDIEIDIVELDSLITNDSLSLTLLERVLNIYQKPVSADSLQIILNSITTFNIFSTRNITYESIKSSGKFELLDLKLRIDIIEFYHTGYREILDIENYYRMNFDNQVIPFILDAFSNDIDLEEDVFKSEKFRTILQIHLSFLAQKHDACKKGKKLAIKLDEELKSYLQ